MEFKTLFIFALIAGFIYLLGVLSRAKAEKCLQFGDNVFEGPDGNCYSCPNGFTVQTEQKDQDTGKIVLNSLGVPVCIANTTKPMKILRKTSSPANVIPGGYMRAEMVGTNLAKSESNGSFTKPVESSDVNTMNEICQKRYSKNGLTGPINWTTYDPKTNSCQVCSDNFYKNPNVNDFTNSQICQSYFGTSHAPIETKPIDLDSFTCPTGLEKVINATDNSVICYKCPDGYNRNPNKHINSSQACQTSCPIGSSPDEKSGMCYTCPDGYIRTSADINSTSACKKPCQEGTFEGNYDDVGSFGKCYKCPSGYSRTKEPLNSDKACFVNCPIDSFTFKDQCYKCPDGYSKNENAISPDEACYKPCSVDGSNIFEYRETQSCYECPVGYTKDPNQNVSPFNSLACINKQQKPANLISVVGEDGKMVPPEVIQDTLKNIKGVLG